MQREEAGEALTHVDAGGAARMVDVGDKPITTRVARAGARVWMAGQTMDLLVRQAFPKGDVLTVARVAGIMAAKRTPELVPLCHTLALNHVDISFDVRPADRVIDIECEVRTDARTGVEMEAIVGVSIAAITIYDMCKAVDRAMTIGDIRLLEKRGGRQNYVRSEVDIAPADSQPDAPPKGVVLSVNVSPGKGERKKPVEEVLLLKDHGIENDGHAGPWHRQVSLLAQESIDKMLAKGLDVGPGDFAENLTVSGLDLPALPLGTRLEIGPTLVEVTQIGKVCHDRCAIYYQAGDCVMPTEGIFVRVLRGGRVTPGDPVMVVRWGKQK